MFDSTLEANHVLTYPISYEVSVEFTEDSPEYYSKSFLIMNLSLNGEITKVRPELCKDISLDPRRLLEDDNLMMQLDTGIL